MNGPLPFVTELKRKRRRWVCPQWLIDLAMAALLALVLVGIAAVGMLIIGPDQ